MADVQVTLTLPVLQKGLQPSSGPTVVEKLQLMLNQRKSFPTLVIDGVFGPKTESSLKLFQPNENLTVNGATKTSRRSMRVIMRLFGTACPKVRIGSNCAFS